MDGATVSQISRLEVPSLEEFDARHMQLQQPVILTGAMEDWPALQPAPGQQRGGGGGGRGARWADMQYLKQVAGSHLVPVEVGDSYTAASWQQQLVTFADFVERHIETEGGSDDGDDGRRSLAYLAQHPLFEQIPALREDIRTPEYCRCLPLTEKKQQAVGALEEAAKPAVNGWFGPRDTVTPLHHDPKHNLLCQAVGKKYLRLYPADTNVYAMLMSGFF